MSGEHWDSKYWNLSEDYSFESWKVKKNEICLEACQDLLKLVAYVEACDTMKETTLPRLYDRIIKLGDDLYQ